MPEWGARPAKAQSAAARQALVRSRPPAPLATWMATGLVARRLPVTEEPRRSSLLWPSILAMEPVLDLARQEAPPLAKLLLANSS